MTSDTIAAIATARGPGALAVVRLSGPEAIGIADRLFRPPGKLAALPSHSCSVGQLRDGDDTVDQVVATVYRAPRSYTGEDLVEFSCHGGSLIPARVLDLLFREGARAARPGEFTQRAFLNDRIDLSQAEAVAALVGARSAAGARIAARVLAGGLRAALEQSLDRLTVALARVEATLDVQEDGAPDVLAPTPREDHQGLLSEIVGAETERLAGLLSGGRAGRLLEDGIRVVLVGRPNAGKSSLFNAFLARERALVSAEPGTTRDFLEAEVEWGGLPFVLVDTAGLWEARGALERETVRRTHQAISAATLVVYVVDVSAEEIALDALLSEIRTTPRLIVALHKWDLGARQHWRTSSPPDTGPVRVASSAVEEPGIDGLRQAIVGAAQQEVEDVGSAMVVGERQRHLITEAQTALGDAMALISQNAGGELVAFELRRAADLLGEILGRRVGPEVLEEIFARFCVGK